MNPFIFMCDKHFMFEIEFYKLKMNNLGWSKQNNAEDDWAIKTRWLNKPPIFMNFLWTASAAICASVCVFECVI